MKRNSHLDSSNPVFFSEPTITTPPAAESRRGPQHLLIRTRLFEVIERPFQATLTTIVAPPGYGKSVLASTWAARSSDPIAWIDLSAAENDPQVLLRTLSEAIKSTTIVCPAERSPATPIDGVKSTLDDRLTAIAQPVCVILDQCDHLRSVESINLDRKSVG